MDDTSASSIVTVVVVAVIVGFTTFVCSFVGKFIAMKLLSRRRLKIRKFEAKKRRVFDVSL